MSDLRIPPGNFNYKAASAGKNTPVAKPPQGQDEVAKQLAAMQGLKPKGT